MSVNLPADFVRLVQPVVGDEWDAFVEALSSEPVTSVRMNDKPCGTAYDSCRSVPWCPQGRYLDVRPRFTADPCFHAGGYYVQEASSMFLYQALRQYVAPDSVVLDMCAAPGGKSTLICSHLSDDALIVANEYVPQRAHILVENMTKWGYVNKVVTNNAPHHFEVLGEFFDAVCVDAPCSGEGMFRKDDNAIAEWSAANVTKCVERQRQILQSAWRVLRPGGVLIYSTCTYNRQENEDNVGWLIEEYGAEYLPIDVLEDWNIVSREYGYRFMPHKTRGEGLFLAVVRKPEDDYTAPRFRLPKRLPERADALLYWVKCRERFTTVVRGNTISAIPVAYMTEVLYMIEHLNVMAAGIDLATAKGKDFIPHQALAMSDAIDESRFVTVDVDYDTAISYLRTEAVVLGDCPRGFVLLTYNSVPLGWVKNVGNRCNNLYPDAWRIRF